MTQTILALRERRNALANDARTLLENHPGDKWKAEHNEQFDKIHDEIARIDSEISRNQKMLDADADRKFKDLGGRERNVDGKLTTAAAINKWLRGGDRAMTEDDWSVANTVMSPANDGYHVVRNEMSGDPANGSEGGYTVPTDIVARITEALKAFGGMRNVSTVFQTSGGNPLSFPTSDGTSEEGEIVPENQLASDQDVTFGTMGIPVYKFSSKVITVPFELLQDSAVDIEAFIAKRLATRLGRIQNRKFTVGTGTNEPRGIVVAAPIGKVGLTGQTGTVIYDDLVDLQHSVDPAYREQGNARFMFNDGTLAKIRKLKDTQGRPIFIPGYYDNGIAAGIPDTLAGSRFQINQQMPDMAANAKPILYGDFSTYMIRDVMGFTLFRFTDSAYTKKGQVGFLAWMRSGGNQVDVGGSVKAYQNPAS